jgi:uncharacterized membrane protein YeaQ/YmgE (transglycosylase-associated protein family)
MNIPDSTIHPGTLSVYRDGNGKDKRLPRRFLRGFEEDKHMLQMTSLAAVALSPGNFIVWLIVGGIAGWITGRIMGGGFGFIGDIVVGLIGAFIGSLIIGFFVSGTAGFWGTLVVAVIGAVILTAILRAFSHGTTARV